MVESGVQTVEASIVIPAYNEAARGLGSVLLGAHKVFEKEFGSENYQIIVASDGSTDETAVIASDHGAQVLDLPHGGKGSAVRQGILSTDSPIRAFMDADGSFDPVDVLRLMTSVSGASDIAIATRENSSSHDSRLRAFGHTTLSKICDIVAPTGLSDTQCGAKAFKGDVADKLFGLSVIDGFAFDLEVLHLANKLGYRVTEQICRVDPKEGSKVRPVQDGLRMLTDAVQIRRKHQSLQ